MDRLWTSRERVWGEGIQTEAKGSVGGMYERIKRRLVWRHCRIHVGKPTWWRNCKRIGRADYPTFESLKEIVFASCSRLPGAIESSQEITWFKQSSDSVSMPFMHLLFPASFELSFLAIYKFWWWFCFYLRGFSSEFSISPVTNPRNPAFSFFLFSQLSPL